MSQVKTPTIILANGGLPDYPPQGTMRRCASGFEVFQRIANRSSSRYSDRGLSVKLDYAMWRVSLLFIDTFSWVYHPMAEFRLEGQQILIITLPVHKTYFVFGRRVGSEWIETDIKEGWRFMFSKKYQIRVLTKFLDDYIARMKPETE